MLLTSTGDLVQDCASKLEALSRMALAKQEDSWDEARLMLNAWVGAEGVGLATACRLGGLRKSGFVMSMEFDAHADGLLEALRAEVGGDVHRIRLCFFRESPTTIDWLPSEAPGLPKWAWPDEPDYDGPVSQPTPPHRTLDHAYVSSDPSAVSTVDSLARIRAWLDENAPGLSALLNPPATLQAIADAESKWGVTFPASVREAYLVHDGQSHPNRERVFRDWLWLPLDELESQFRWTREHVDGDEIIPILESDGVSGGVRSVEKPGDESEFFSTGDGSDVVFADSFSLFLDQFAGELEAGTYVYWNGLFQLVEELEEIDDDEFD